MVANNSKTTGGATGKGFKPGQSGNPNGRPKIADEFRGKCREFMSDEKVFNLNHCAQYIKSCLPHKDITVREIIEILEIETEYMLKYGYAE